MNPTQEYVLKEALIGLMRGIANAFESMQAQLLQPATAHQRADADLRATRRLRRMAVAYEQDPDVAELRYWKYVDAGWRTQEALEKVRLELERS